MTDQTASYRKKPIPVEARQVPSSSDGQSGLDLAAWCGGSVSGTYAEPKIFVPTLEGELVARVGDWIVKGTRGEFWPVKGDIFAETYEPALPTPTSDPAVPVCKFDEGCHRVVACEPGCAVAAADMHAKLTAAVADRAGLVEVAAQAIRDSNGTPEALEWWRIHPQLIPAHVYAAAVLAVLPASVDRGAVLLEAADEAANSARLFPDDDECATAIGALEGLADRLRRLAVEASDGQTTQGEQVVAYRSPGTRALYCLICARQETGWQPLGADQVLDGVLCDFCCGRVHDVASRTLGTVVARYADGPAGGAQQPKEA